MDDLSPPPPSTGSGQGPSTLRQGSGQAGSGQGFISLPVFFGFAAGIFAGVALALLAFLAFYLLREEPDAATSPAPRARPSPAATPELRPGASLTLVTSVYRVEKDQIVIATVNPNGSVTEKSLANNTLR